MSVREKTLELPRTISETIYIHLKKAIVSGELKPGQRVQEKDIAALFNVSSTPVREAFFRLAAERYLAINARKEVLVQGASIEEVRELYEVVRALDLYAVKKIAGRLPESDVRLLEAMTRKLGEYYEANDHQRYLEQNLRIHDWLWRANGNMSLHETLTQLMEKIAIYRKSNGFSPFADRKALDKSYADHVGILSALERGDKASLESIISSHWGEEFCGDLDKCLNTQKEVISRFPNCGIPWSFWLQPKKGDTSCRSEKRFFSCSSSRSPSARSSPRPIPTGKLTGTVTDAENGALPGVNVTISSPALILPQMSSVTNENGLYKFFNLPSGTYKVVFELQGFKGVVREGILVSATHTTTLDIALEQGALENTLTVVGQSPTVDMEKTQTGTTFTKDLINSLPLARDLSSIFNAAPGMFSRTSHGSDARSNDFVVDGVKMQDPVTGDPYQTVPWNAIDEVEIETSNQKAEYGAVKGALVQVITKAGGNAFTGGVNFYFRNKSLQSDNTKGTPLAGKTFVGFKNQYLPGLLVRRAHQEGQALVLRELRHGQERVLHPGLSGGRDPRRASACQRPLRQENICSFPQADLAARQDVQGRGFGLLSQVRR